MLLGFKEAITDTLIYLIFNSKPVLTKSITEHGSRQGGGRGGHAPPGFHTLSLKPSKFQKIFRF